VRQSTRRSSKAIRPPQSNTNQSSTAVKGDVFTKVTIGRTKSFVKTGNQYNLQELFRELKEKEGVESIDDVLRRVISPDGMSFNDIKPVYRELLLKLAMTMSQDEIFERSKTIMAHTRKRQKKYAARNGGDLSSGGSLGSFFKSLSSKSVSSNKLPKNTTGSLPPAIKTNKMTLAKIQYDKNSSSGTKQAKSIRYQSSRQLTKADISSPIPLKAGSNSMRNDKLIEEDEQHQQDDAYVSCSECYSACTYTSCSTSCQERGKILQSASKEKDKEQLLSECDADSCISSEKCYCSLRGHPEDKKHGTSHLRPSTCSIYSEVTDSGTGSHRNCINTSCYSSSSVCYSTMDRGSSNCSSSSGIVTSTSSAAEMSPRRHKADRTSVAAAANDSPLTAWKRNTGDLEALSKSGRETTDTHTCCSCSSSSVSSSHYSDTSAVVPNNSLKFGRHLPPIPPEDKIRRLSDNTAAQRRKVSNGYHEPFSSDSLQPWDHQETIVVRGRTNLRDGRGSLGASSCSSASMSPSSSQSSSSPSILSYRHRSSSATRSSTFSLPHQQPPKFLLLSAVDPRGNLVYCGPAAGGIQKQQPPLVPKTAGGGGRPSGGGGHFLDASQNEDNIMSMKKSAEIAAMFAGARISQTTDLVDGIQIDHTYSGDHHRGSSHEGGRAAGGRLGYFP
jgi:hypothetical protein